MMTKIEKYRSLIFNRPDWIIIFISFIAIMIFHANELIYLFGFKWVVAPENQTSLVSHLPDLPRLFLFLCIPLIVLKLSEEIFQKKILTVLFSLGVLALELLTSFFFSDIWDLGVSYAVPGHSKEISHVSSIPLLPGLIYGFLLMGYIFISWRKASLSKNLKQITVLSMLGILALAFTLRWETMLSLQAVGLDPDVKGYRSIATNMSHLYDTSLREPLWPWMLRIWFILFGSSDFYVRLITVFLSMVGLYAVYRFFLEYTKSSLLTLSTIFFLAIDTHLIFMSVRGLRLEIYMITIVMFAYFAFVVRDRFNPNWRILNLGFWGMLAELIRINSLVFLIPMLIFAFWKHRLAWRKLIIPIGIILMFLAPHLLTNYQQTGDWLRSANVHAIWFRNYEFVVVKGIGCEGCPTLEEMNEFGWYAGDPTTTFQYIFGMHSLVEVFKNLVLGYLEIFVRYLANMLQIPLELWLMPIPFLIGFIGFGLLLLSPFRETILFAILLVNLIAFVVPIQDFDPRHAAHVKPFIAFMLAFFVYGVCIILPRIITKLKQMKSKSVYKAAWQELKAALAFNKEVTEISK